jgi:hypothetical protein
MTLAEDLDRHPAAVLPVFGQIDGRHPATTELAFERVAVSQRLL